MQEEFKARVIELPWAAGAQGQPEMELGELDTYSTLFIFLF